MQQVVQVSLEDQVCKRLASEAARLNISVDTYVSTLIMKSASEPLPENGSARPNLGPFRLKPSESVQEAVAQRINEAGSPGKSLIGLFSDIPDVMDAIVADAMAARSEPWRVPDDESSS